MTHTHSHATEQPSYGQAFALGISLNLFFVLIEAFYGWHANSLALLADAAHNLSDVAGLLLAWVAYGVAKLRPNVRHTYGWRKASILASFANAVFLLIAMGSLATEAISRFGEPGELNAETVMVVAGVGVIINAITAWLFMRGSRSDLNIRGAFLHMAADAFVSLGVVVSGAFALWLGWTQLDPVVSLVIAIVIVIATLSLFKQSLHMLFDGVPDSVDLNAIQNALLETPGVRALHDLHVWNLSTTETALTAHLTLEQVCQSDEILADVIHLLAVEFHIEHVTIQCESTQFTQDCQLNRLDSSHLKYVH